MPTFWDKEKIENQRLYFANERIEKRGKFTEFVVRSYYCICKSCSINDGISCRASEVSAYKIKFVIYEGFYDGVPDHDNKSVIDDCIKHLKLMNYIKFKKLNDVWMIYLNKPLDFLLEGEHNNYLEKYKIINNISYLL